MGGVISNRDSSLRRIDWLLSCAILRYRIIKIEYHDTESGYRNAAIKYHSNGIEYQVAKIEARYQEREHIRCSKSGR